MLAGDHTIKIKKEPDQDTFVDGIPVSPPPTACGQDKEESESSESEVSSDVDYDEYEAIENFQIGRFMFCQRCSNLMTFDTDEALKCHRLVCPTCPFFLNVTKGFVLSKEKLATEDEEKEIIYDSSKANEHRQKTEVLCPECTNQEAYFYQMQTRSADEPMTNFYQCVKCKHNWRD